MEISLYWVISLGFSLIAGHYGTNEFVKRVRSHYEISKKWIEENFDFKLPTLPQAATGMLERLFFTILIAYNVSGVATAMMTYLLVKAVSHWNLLLSDKEEKSYEEKQHKARLRGREGTFVQKLPSTFARASPFFTS